MIAAFWADVAPVIYLVTVPAVVVAALVFGFALARQAALNDEPLNELDDREFPGLVAWGDELHRATRHTEERSNA